MHVLTQDAGVALRNRGDEVGGTSESDGGGETTDGSHDLPFESKWLQSFINRSHLKARP